MTKHLYEELLVHARWLCAIIFSAGPAIPTKEEGRARTDGVTIMELDILKSV